MLRRQRIVYISTTKNASTALRWMIADLAGEDFTDFYRAAAPHQSRLMTIHGDRAAWRHVPTLADLPPEELAGISRDDGWLIFAVVRDPWRRMWSSWQSKLLLRQGGYTQRHQHQPWFPRVPASIDDVLDDWRAFVTAQPWRSEPDLRADSHFNAQVRGIRPRHVNYSRVYDVSALGELVADVRSHLAALGMQRDLYLPRANESVLPLVAQALDGDVREILRGHAEKDLAAFPGRWQLPHLPDAADVWSADALRTVRWRIESNERVTDLSRELRGITESRVWRLLHGAAQAARRRA